uniref:Peptidase M13 N-terminal domain-containing protein n=1 Tax=Romanomermis culicivorax TaxID=13658 RepID=A0A915L593_ROMCU
MPRLSVPGAYLHLKGQKKSSSSIILTEEQSFDSGAATSSSLNDNGQISPPMPTEDPYYPDDRVYMADDAMTTTTVSGQTTVSILGEDDDDDDDERGGVSAIVDGAAVHFKTPMSCGGAATPKLSPNARCHKLVSPFWAFCFGGARSNINNNNNNNKGPFFVTMSIILMVLTLVVILMLLKSGKSSRPDFFDVNATAAPFLIKNEQICATSSCVKAASNLLQAIDFSVDPCQNFYDYACGQWNKDHPIPDDVAAYGTFAFVRDLVRQQLRGALSQIFCSSMYDTNLYQQGCSNKQ